MRWKARRSWINAGVLILAVGLAACGSSGGSSSDTAGANSSPGTGAGGSAPSGSVTVDTNFTGQGSSDVCSFAKQVQQSGDLATGDVSKATLDKVNDAFAKLEEKAPAEIKSDVQTVAKAFATFRAVYAKYGYDPAKLTSAAATDTDVQNLEKQLTDPSFQSASARIDAYFRQVCGISGSS